MFATHLMYGKENVRNTIFVHNIHMKTVIGIPRENNHNNNNIAV